MLFDAPLLPGLYFREELLTESQEAGLIEAIGRTPVSSLDELNDALKASASRESIVLRIHRGDQSESGLEEQLVVWKRAAEGESSDR